MPKTLFRGSENALPAMIGLPDLSGRLFYFGGEVDGREGYRSRDC